jgi:FixJ family two-component response regulator
MATIFLPLDLWQLISRAQRNAHRPKNTKHGEKKSLDEPINGETFLDIIPAVTRAPADCEELEKHLERQNRSVARFLDSLCKLDRKICDILMEGRSIRSIAIILGLTHTGVRYRLGRDIAEKAAEFGLGQFVEVAE